MKFLEDIRERFAQQSYLTYGTLLFPTTYSIIPKLPLLIPSGFLTFHAFPHPYNPLHFARPADTVTLRFTFFLFREKKKRSEGNHLDYVQRHTNSHLSFASFHHLPSSFIVIIFARISQPWFFLSCSFSFSASLFSYSQLSVLPLQSSISFAIFAAAFLIESAAAPAKTSPSSRKIILFFTCTSFIP